MVGKGTLLIVGVVPCMIASACGIRPAYTSVHEQSLVVQFILLPGGHARQRAARTTRDSRTVRRCRSWAMGMNRDRAPQLHNRQLDASLTASVA